MSELVSVLVPAQYVTDVYALIARLEGKTGETAETSETQGADWPDDDLRALRDSPAPSVKCMASILDLLVDRPDTPTAFSIIAKDLGIARKDLQGQVGGFSRWVGKRWPDEEISWPIEVQYGEAVDRSIASEAFYSISRSTAASWKRIRTEVGN